MKYFYITLAIFLLFFYSCSKPAAEYKDIAEKSLSDEKVDIAISNLQLLLEKHPSDSLASFAQYKLAMIYLNWKNDLDRGFNALKKTSNNYKNSKQSQMADEQLKQFPEWILNQSESLRKRKLIRKSIEHLEYLVMNYEDHGLAPKGQYMIGDIYMNDLRDFKIAIQEYRKISMIYPGSNQEPHAQFMIGYIFANVLNDYESAKIEYENFINQFPKHELVPSVKFELEYLGKNINEIPALKHITTS